MLERIGPKTAPPKAARIPIEFAYIVDDELVVEIFQIVDKRMDMHTINKLGPLADQGEEVAIRHISAIVNMVAKMFDNTDGVKAQWVLAKLPPQEGDTQPRFRGPDGEIYDWEYANSWDDPKEWSSRRRWMHLMNDNDDADVDIDSVMALVKRVISVAAGRPTHASA